MASPRMVVLFAFLVVGCNRFVADIAARHTVLVFDGSTSAPLPELRAEYLAWTNEAVNRRGSSVTLCASGPDGGRCSSPIAPPMWRSQVLRAKAEFRRDAPGLLDAALRARSTWKSPPSHLSDGAAVILVSGATKPFGWRAQLATVGAPVQTIVLVDVSPSASAVLSDTADLRAEYDRFLKSGGIAVGSSFTVKRVGQDLATTTELYHIELHDEDAGRRMLSALAARHEFERIELDGASAGSAVAEAAYTAAMELQQLEGDLRLVFRSDLQQFSRALGSFEQQVPSSAQFIADLQREHLTPALKGVAIEVCGTHFRATGGRTISARSDAALKHTWQEAWTAFGARSVHFSTRCEGSIPVRTSTEGA